MTTMIYGPARFTSTGRVLITLFEKGIEDFKVVDVDLVKGEHKYPEFLKSQPFGQVPYIVDGDLTLFESRAIARTIATKYADQGTPLYGTTAAEKAVVEQWLEVESQNFNLPISTIVYNVVVGPIYGVPSDEAVVAAHSTQLETVLDIYEERLSRSKYLAGDFFSLADLSHITYSYYLIHMTPKGASVFACRPHVMAWIDSLFSRPSTQKWLMESGFSI